MLVGHKHWHTVSTETCGVPRGGRYGCVKKFEAEANRHGLYLGWSLARRCFILFSKRGFNKYVCQWVFARKSTGEPVPLTMGDLKTLLLARERFCRDSAKTIIAGVLQADRDRKQKAAKELYQRISRNVPEAHRMALLDIGKRTPKIWSIPNRGRLVRNALRRAN